MPLSPRQGVVCAGGGGSFCLVLPLSPLPPGQRTVGASPAPTLPAQRLPLPAPPGLWAKLPARPGSSGRREGHPPPDGPWGRPGEDSRCSGKHRPSCPQARLLRSRGMRRGDSRSEGYLLPTPCFWGVPLLRREPSPPSGSVPGTKTRLCPFPCLDPPLRPLPQAGVEGIPIPGGRRTPKVGDDEGRLDSSDAIIASVSPPSPAAGLPGWGAGSWQLRVRFPARPHPPPSWHRAFPF